MADFQEAFDAGKLASEVKSIEGGGTFVLSGVQPVDLEKFLPKPIRHRATVRADTTESFIEYFNKFKGDASAIFADQSSRNVVGIIDYHGADPAFREHRVSYTAPLSEEWKRWKGGDGTKMGQEDFAFFMEENVTDVVDPPGADILEVSRNLKVKKHVEFEAETRLSDGSVQFTFSEEVKNVTTKGVIKVPEEFSIGVPIYFGGQKYKVVAKLRYRMAGGHLTMWYDLHRREYIEQDAFNGVVETIREGAGVTPYMGVP